MEIWWLFWLLVELLPDKMSLAFMLLVGFKGMMVPPKTTVHLGLP